MSISKPSLSIVIPCLNEEQAIDSVLDKIENISTSDQFRNYFSSCEVIVVDDGSTDMTAELLSRRPNIRVLRNLQSCGYGAALKQGFASASGSLVTFLDMDFSYEPNDILDLYEEMTEKNADMVFGNRLGKHNGMPEIRLIGNRFFSIIVKLFFWKKITDVCTGFRLFKHELVSEILELKTNNLNFSIDLTLLMLGTKKVISQKPIRYYERKGESKLNVFKDGFEFLWIVLKNFYRFKIQNK